jgi:hypothetical protein
MVSNRSSTCKTQTGWKNQSSLLVFSFHRSRLWNRMNVYKETLRLGAHMQFSVVQLFDRPIICYAHTVKLNDRSTVMSAHMQLNSCCNDKLC